MDGSSHLAQAPKPHSLTPRKNVTLCGDGDVDCLPNERITVLVSASLFGIVVGLALFLLFRRLLYVNKRKTRNSGPWLRDPFNAHDTDTDTVCSRDRTQSESSAAGSEFSYRSDGSHLY